MDSELIISRLNKIEMKLEQMEINTNKMGKHVDNVEFLLTIAHPIINICCRLIQRNNHEVSMNLNDGLELD